MLVGTTLLPLDRATLAFSPLIKWNKPRKKCFSFFEAKKTCNTSCDVSPGKCCRHKKKKKITLLIYFSHILTVSNTFSSLSKPPPPPPSSCCFASSIHPCVRLHHLYLSLLFTLSSHFAFSCLHNITRFITSSSCFTTWDLQHLTICCVWTPIYRPLHLVIFALTSFLTQTWHSENQNDKSSHYKPSLKVSFYFLLSWTLWTQIYFAISHWVRWVLGADYQSDMMIHIKYRFLLMSFKNSVFSVYIR